MAKVHKNVEFRYLHYTKSFESQCKPV